MHKVLIANRGEIALRLIRACQELGLETVAVYSTADSESLHVLAADEAVCIGEAPAKNSYLDPARLLSACDLTGADALHPGYGFLSENAKFAELCEQSGVKFIGPTSKLIDALGNKSQAKATAKSASCPTIPGSEGILRDLAEAKSLAKSFGYPVLVKATAGGGGKGIRICMNEGELEKNFQAASSEALAAFGCGDLYLEKMIEDPRHVEVQIAADEHGHVIHLFERDCTIQRRRQKLIEEAPSPILSETLRAKICQAAVNVAKEAGYCSLGTVEFLLDKEMNFYFMEMNTRIQVEHTVTEELTGIDLAKLQINIARGEKLPFKQKQIEKKGHVIQFRINAEDPALNFAPRPGTLEYYIPPGGPHVRLDSACYSGYKIPPHYDSMIAKLIVRGKDREEAMAVGRRALGEFHIRGVPSTIPFHQLMLDERFFQEDDYTINTIDKLLEEGVSFTIKDED